MTTFASGSEVVLTFDMIDPSTSEPITPSSASWSLFDDEGQVLHSGEPLTVTGAETDLRVTVPSASNDQGARTVALNVTFAGGSITLLKTYALEAYAPLIVPSQSAMTEAAAMVVRGSIASSGMDEWDYAEEKTRRAALQEAWSRFKLISFKPWRDNQSVSGLFQDVLTERGTLVIEDLSLDMFRALPTHFIDALKKAQLTEAASILESEDAFARRRDGLISKTVGESSEMFTTRGLAVKVIHPSTQRILAPFIRRSVSIGRA